MLPFRPCCAGDCQRTGAIEARGRLALSEPACSGMEGRHGGVLSRREAACALRSLDLEAWAGTLARDLRAAERMFISLPGGPITPPCASEGLPLKVGRKPFTCLR